MMSFGDSSYSLSTSFFWLHVHWVFLGLALFGFIAAIIFLFKHATKNTVRSTMAWALILGIVGLLITSPWAARGAFSMMGMMQGGTYGWDEEGFQSTMADYMEEEWDEVEAEYGEDPSMQDMMDYLRGDLEEEEDAEEESSAT